MGSEEEKQEEKQKEGDEGTARRATRVANAPIPKGPKVTGPPVDPSVEVPPGVPPHVATREKLTRRSLLSSLSLGWVAYTVGFGTFLAICQRFLFPNVNFEPSLQFKVGYPTDFEVNQVDERFKAQYGVWVCRNPERIYALSTVCTHLGCTPNWLEAERKFKCPCHGSGFRFSGINFEGPAPRPLERFKITLADDGQILVDKERKFQYEKGQWDDPEASLVV